MPGDIPGYHYDLKKKKYFKVQPHQNVPAGAAYSKENVRKEKRERSKEELKRHQLEPLSFKKSSGKFPPRIRRAPALQHPHLGAFSLDRSFGYLLTKGPTDCNVRAAYAAGVQTTKIFSSPLEWDVDKDRWMKNPEGKCVYSTFVRDPLMGGLYLALSEMGGEIGSDGQFVPRAVDDWSISLTTRGNPRVERPTVQLLGLHRPETSTNEYPENVLALAVLAPAYTSESNIAIGTERGVTIIHEAPDDLVEKNTWPCHVNDGIKTSDATVLAVEFMSHDTILAGERNGDVAMVDTREWGQYMRCPHVRHPSSVQHVKRVDEHRLIACGLESKIAMYDLRFSRATKAKGIIAITRPVLEYEHHNEFRPGLGFDIDVDAGVVAAAREDKTVRLYDLHTAERLRCPALEKEPFRDHVRCIRFSPRVGEEGPAPLLVSESDRVYEIKW